MNDTEQSAADENPYLPESSRNPDAVAQMLVGKFLQAFARLEKELDEGIGKLLGLEPAQNYIVCSSIPFAKKIGVFFSAEDFVASMPETERKKKLVSTKKSALALNTIRVIFAHCEFDAYPYSADTVQFKRVVADGKLVIEHKLFTAVDVEALCSKASDTSDALKVLVTEMRRYTPSLDFSDPRNSGYAFFLGLF